MQLTQESIIAYQQECLRVENTSHRGVWMVRKLTSGNMWQYCRNFSIGLLSLFK